MKPLPPPTMTLDEAIRYLRTRPEHAALVRDSYLGADVLESAARFEASGELAETLRLLGDLRGRAVLDLGAGIGMASRAFCRAGAGRVVAVEPDPSEEVGRGALARVVAGSAVEIVADPGEALPFPTGTFDVVYGRQVLHHAGDLPKMLSECARVLRPGGVFLACREPVADSERQLAALLRSHPVHVLAGGEHAYSTKAYVAAIERAGLRIIRVLGPVDSVVNAFPRASTPEELADLPRILAGSYLGSLGRAIAAIPGFAPFAWYVLRRLPVPGRPITLLAVKPT